MSACEKHKHKSEGAAKAHIRALLKIGNDEFRHPYFCEKCVAWHVGRLKQSRSHQRQK